MQNEEEYVCGGNFVATSAILHTWNTENTKFLITNTLRKHRVNKHMKYQQMTAARNVVDQSAQ